MPTSEVPSSAVSTGISPGAHIADPAPLGLAAFALTTFFLSFVNAGWVPASVEPVVFGLALAYGGAAQFAAGMWEFTKGNTFGATAFTSYGAFWLSFWWLTAHLADYKIQARRVRRCADRTGRLVRVVRRRDGLRVQEADRPYRRPLSHGAATVRPSVHRPSPTA
jgi:succinate-acetate transporter protein